MKRGNLNGTIFHSLYVLLRKGTSSIQGEDPAKRVNINFVSDIHSKKAYYDSKSKIIYISYPKSHIDYIQNLLLNSEKIRAQFFYYGKEKKPMVIFMKDCQVRLL